MDSQMQTNFVNHVLNFFAFRGNDEAGPKLEVEGAAPTITSTPREAACPDLPVLLGLLRTAGFIVKYSDKSDSGGYSHGCKVIILCKRSGTRIVMDGEGPCTCPSEDSLKRYLDTSSAGRAPSRAPSPTPSTACMLDDPLNNSSMSARDKSPIPEADAVGDAAAAAVGLSRQRTWSRDGDAEDKDAKWAAENRRLSAPPGAFQSPWATLNGDELNVLAATDLLTEAISLLSGVKKTSLRNTPVGPRRRVSAMASRRMSTDTFAQPALPLSRTSSASSGLASSRSTSSTTSLPSNHSGTPRPPRYVNSAGIGGGVDGVAGGTSTGPSASTLRRTISVSAGSGAKKSASVVRTKSDAGKKELILNSRSSVPKVPSLLKVPSVGITKSSTSVSRTPMRIGIKTNASLTIAKAHPKKAATSPEVEPVKL